MRMSLLWKLMLPVVAVLLVGVAAMAWVVPALMKQNAEESALAGAEKTVAQFKTLRAYYTRNVIKKVLDSEDIRPSFDHKEDSTKIPLPATLIHDLSELLEKEGTTLKLYSKYPFPNRQSRRLDDFGQQAWQALSRDSSTPFYRTENINGQAVVRVGVADTMVADACVNCHNTMGNTPKDDWKLGDLRGVLEVDVSIEDQLAAAQSVARQAIGFLALSVLVIGAVIVLIYRRTVGAGLERVTSSLDEIAAGEGDLTRQLDANQLDEIGDLSRSFNRFQSQVRDMISSISHSMGELSESAMSLSSMSEETTTAMGEQDHQTRSASQSVAELAGAIDRIAATAAEATDDSLESQRLTSRGKKVMDDNIALVDQLEQQVAGLGGVMAELTDDSQKIGGVLDVIQQIAEQTNLLALNAAIEAARAGEHGRGFAVVADEVRALAAKTRQSTVEIQSIIEHLQESVTTARQAMDENSEYTAATLKGISEAGQSLNDVVVAVSSIAARNQEIATITQAQNETANAVRQNMEAISDSSSQVVAGTEATAVSSARVSGVAEELQIMISKFKY